MKHRRRKRKRSRISLAALAPAPAPGVVRVDPHARKSVVRMVAFGPDELIERELTSLDDARAFVGRSPVVWIDVEGLGDGDVIHRIGELFGLHPLALEDVVNVHQPLKVETYPDHVFVVVRRVAHNGGLETEQISLFLGQGFVVTFQEGPPDPFEPVRKRLREDRGRIRAADAGNLSYALIDAIVDSYFPVVEEFGGQLDALEDELVGRPDTRLIAQAHEIKHDLRTLRRARLAAAREAIRSLGHEATTLINPETQIYLRDCYDHVAQIMDLIETYREVNTDLTDLYLSSLSNRMNEVMKVLTIIATIFMPLSFIAGLYGMNFNPAASQWNMPELNWRFGYPFALAIMAGSVASMLGFFRFKGWIGPAARRQAAENQANGAQDAKSPQA